MFYRSSDSVLVGVGGVKYTAQGCWLVWGDRQSCWGSHAYSQIEGWGGAVQVKSKTTLGRENSTCKGPEVGEKASLSSRMIQPMWPEISKAPALLEQAGARLQRTLQIKAKALNLILRTLESLWRGCKREMRCLFYFVLEDFSGCG